MFAQAALFRDNSWRRANSNNCNRAVCEIAKHKSWLGSCEGDDTISMDKYRAGLRRLIIVRIDARGQVDSQHPTRRFVHAKNRLLRNALDWRFKARAENRIDDQVCFERLLDLRLLEVGFP